MSEPTDAEMEAIEDARLNGQIEEYERQRREVRLGRMTLSGVLHGSVIRKQKGTLLDQILVDALIDMGKITYEDRRWFYAPRYYLTDFDVKGPLGKPYRLLSFKGQPKALSLALRGHMVEVRATIDGWANGIGAHLLRPEILSVSKDRAVGHECDSPRACGSVRTGDTRP